MGIGGDINGSGNGNELKVGFYLSGVIFLFGISLLELGVIGGGFTRENKMQSHFILLIGFLVVAHTAMIFGMTSP